MATVFNRVVYVPSLKTFARVVRGDVEHPYYKCLVDQDVYILNDRDIEWTTFPDPSDVPKDLTDWGAAKALITAY